MSRMAGNKCNVRLGGLLAVMMAFACVLASQLITPQAAFAMKPIEVNPDQGRIEITTLGKLYEGRGDSIQIETAPGADGMTGRMSVSAVTQGTSPSWIVFALTNPTDKRIERWLTADRYTVVGSGSVWPDLDARRIESVTPSIGFLPERVESDRADIFRITLEPGQTITYVAEFSLDRFARLYLWKPLDYELRTSRRQLFNGVMLGLTGLMAIFLTAIFAANHKPIFPVSALVAWCALAYLCVDFGFFHKLFNLKPEGNAIYRAAAEAALASSLVVFLHVFLRLGLWHGLVRMLITVWLLAQFALIAVAIIDPRLAATFARLSFAFIGATGAGLVLFLAFKGQDRALSLIPTWILFLVWIFGASVMLSGQLAGDLVVSGLVAGLVLIVLLIGFTVTQFAFRSVEPIYGAAPTELQARSLAVDASGTATWEWNARRDEVKVSTVVENWLGLVSGDLNTRTDDFLKHLHPSDRERFRLALFALQERRDGRINCDFRIRQSDNSYRWFEINGAAVPGTDPRAFKCIGLLRDITDQRRAHERLLHDAVHDSVTGLPNRKLVLDRLEVAVARARAEQHIRPTMIVINMDKFTTLNSSLGLVLGDSLLLTIARRLQRHLGVNDTLARLGGDQFAILMLNDQPVTELAAHAERIRRSLRSPIKIAGQEVVLTGSLGISVYDGSDTSHEDLLKQAEIAMYRAKREGTDRIEVFSPEMRGEQDEWAATEAQLRTALDKGQVKVFYRPIVYLPTEELAGFEAQLLWDHPTLGKIDPTTILPSQDESDISVKLGAFALARATHASLKWQKEHKREDESPIFVLTRVPAKHLFRTESLQELRQVLGRPDVPKGMLKIVVSEQTALENPEISCEILERLRATGVDIALDQFGTGFTSLTYLSRLPVDALTIDPALVQLCSGEGHGDTSLLRAVVSVAREFGKSIISYGAETEAEAALLRSIGCEYAVGTYCGSPIAEMEVASILSFVRKSERKLKPQALFRTKSKRKSGADKDLPAKVRTGRKVGAGHRPKVAQAGPAKQPPAGAPATRPAPPHAATTPPPMPQDTMQDRGLGPPPANGKRPDEQMVPPPLVQPAAQAHTASVIKQAQVSNGELPSAPAATQSASTSPEPSVALSSLDGGNGVSSEDAPKPLTASMLPQANTSGERTEKSQPPASPPVTKAVPQQQPPAPPPAPKPRVAAAPTPAASKPSKAKGSVPPLPPMPPSMPAKTQQPAPQKPPLPVQSNEGTSTGPLPVAATNGGSNDATRTHAAPPPGASNGAPPPVPPTTPGQSNGPAANVPDFSHLPPAIAESLKRLAGQNTPSDADKKQ